MDSSAFDTATQRLSGLLSRRRSLGVLAALGLSAGVLLDTAEAKHKHKKRKKHNKPKKTCPACTACETCVKGACQPVADRTACGVGGTCRHNVCARSCTFDFDTLTDSCPTGSSCVDFDRGKPGFCAPTDVALCNVPPCGSDAACPAGQACINSICDIDPVTLCVPVVPA